MLIGDSAEISVMVSVPVSSDPQPLSEDNQSPPVRNNQYPPAATVKNPSTDRAVRHTVLLQLAGCDC